jgi:hypothetical protein
MGFDEVNGAMRLTKDDSRMSKQYEETPGKQFGNLHERMKYLLAVCRNKLLVDDDVWQAICDLETEVRYHHPANPPYGRRTCSVDERV